MSSKGEDYLDNEYYTYNRWLFRLIGFWEDKTSSKKLIYVCFLNFIIIIAVLEQIYVIFLLKGELNAIAKLLETTLITLCFGSCYYNLLSNGAIMKKILRRIDSDWKKLADKQELLILKEYANISRMCTIGNIISFYLYIGFLIFPSFQRFIQYIFGVVSYNELILPVRFDHFMKNRVGYYLGLCIQYTVIIILCTVAIANYTMFIAVILHACALFNVVVWRINGRFKDNRNNFYGKNKNDKLLNENEWIVDIVKFYESVIEFVDLIKLFYEATNLFEVSFALVIFMIDYFYLFQLFSANVNKNEGLTKLLYIIGSMSVIFAYFHLGQKLIDQSNYVFLTLCQIPFYSLSLKTQKLILFLIMRSTMVCNLSWKGTIVFSHNLFTVVIDFLQLDI
ncbi:odorant receptor 46a-like isoform X2 [Vespa velutina]|uniref:odorant receptor 46a-like isoform X2 n=1 Tax=Vespa velutina TaxID=202808 RepID=UPI001FB45BF7|nr:odorant receptor 46a-like isoform X2 [Vespa velutina]